MDSKVAEEKFRNVVEAYNALADKKPKKQHRNTRYNRKRPIRISNENIFPKFIQELVSEFNTKDLFEISQNNFSHINLKNSDEFHIDLRKNKLRRK